MDQVQPLAPNSLRDSQERPLSPRSYLQQQIGQQLSEHPVLVEGTPSVESLVPAENQSTAAPATVPESNAVPKKRTEDRRRRRDSRSWDGIMKSITSLDEAAKLAFIEEKYNELYSDLKTSKQSLHLLEKQCLILKKDKDQTQSEKTKGILVRSRLENLCRELQKQNKQIKDESLAKIKEEEELRREVSAKFAGKLNDINTLMEESKGKSEKLREENKLMTAKLSELYDEFQKREHDITKMSRDMEIERQYFRAQLEKMELEITAEKQGLVREHASMQSSLEKSETNCQILMNTIKGLQSNIDLYKAQYENFESTMSKSNAIFDSFKSEMDVLTQQVQVFEQEAKSWKNKWQDSATSVLELTKSKQIQETIIQTNEKKINQLQKLCRQLQVDRAAFLKLLKDNNIEPTTQICYEKEPKTTRKKLTKKEKELEILKNNLKVLQNELNIAQREELKREIIQESEATEKGVEPVKEKQEIISEINKQIMEEIDQIPKDTSSPDQTIAIGFSVGDELGFKESISNVEVNRRRSSQASKLQAQLIQAQQKAKADALRIRSQMSDLTAKTEKKSVPTVPPFKPIPPAPDRSSTSRNSSNIPKAAIMGIAVPSFNSRVSSSLPIDPSKPRVMAVVVPVAKVQASDKMSNNFALRTLPTPNEVSAVPQTVSNSIHNILNSTIANEDIIQAALVRQQIIKVKSTTTTTVRPVTSKYANSVGKVMNSPKEYYPVGYDKNFDDNFASRVELPETSFYCGDQKHFPGLYADEDLGCMVFHVCALTDDGLVMKSFLCPESTLFDQTILKCNWWFYVDCKNSKKLYDSNIPISKSYQLMKALTFFSGYKKDSAKSNNKD